MSDPFIGEIRLFAGNFAPAGWNFCDGTILAISENDALFALIGTTYGGDGQQTFALPDLRGRIPVHIGTGAGLSTIQLAQTGGLEAVTLLGANLPAHTHYLQAQAGIGVSQAASNKVWSQDGSGQTSIFSQNAASAPMNPAIVQIAGGSQPHENMPPYLCLSFIISLYGIFPSQS